MLFRVCRARVVEKTQWNEGLNLDDLLAFCQHVKQHQNEHPKPHFPPN